MSNLIGLHHRQNNHEFLAVIKEGLLFDLFFRNHDQIPQCGEIYNAQLRHIIKNGRHFIGLLQCGTLEFSASLPQNHAFEKSRSYQVEITSIPPSPKKAECRIIAPSDAAPEQKIAPAPQLSAMAHTAYPHMRKIDAAGFEDYADAIESLLTAPVTIAETIGLIFEKTNVGHMIDINIPADQARLNANIKAAATIMAQIRLRNLSGLILCDFPNMTKKSERDSLLAKLNSLSAQDPLQPVIHGFTRTGLIEITRQRRERELSESWV